jgi:hypothetical protein
MNQKKIFWLTLFSIAMGFMEAAIVIYLRKIYYPSGFAFPLVPIDLPIAKVELFREFSTIIMLLAIGILSGNNAAEKFAGFIFSFGIWDIFYYVFLKIFLDWPESFFTADILFLIPFPWIGPVIAPCITSATMIALASSVFYFSNKSKIVNIKRNEWLLFITGSIVTIFSYMWNYLKAAAMIGPDFQMSGISSYVPGGFNWLMFLTGELIIITGIIIFLMRINNQSTKAQ